MRKRSIKVLVILLAACMLFTMVGCKKTKGPDTSITESSVILAQGGRSEFSVVISETASEAEKYAADYLVEYFKEATGATLSLRTDAGISFDEDAKVLSVGRTKILEESGLALDKSKLTGDGFRIERFGNTVIICGVEDTGTIYAVQDFLAIQFNYEAYAADEVFIEKVTEPKLMDFHYSDAPDFEGRDMDGDLLYNREAATQLRLRGWSNDSAVYGYGASRDWIGGHCESFLNVLPKEIYEKDHPEWYAYSARQMCLTNTELIDAFVKSMIALIEENPYGKYVNISEEDMAGMCTCPQCTAEMNQYLVSGYIIRFCNTVIEEIEKWRQENCPERDLKYLTFAYSSGSINPPVRNVDGKFEIIDPSVQPHKKLYIRLAPIMYCYSHPFTDESCEVNRAFRTQIEGWKSITDRFMVWDYDVNYSHYFLFFNDYESLSANLKLYKDIGVINIFRQNSTGSRIRSMVDLNNYLNGKLMWDTELDSERLIEDFMEHFYKSGAPYMKQYLAMMRTYLKQKDIDSLAQGGKGLHFQIYDAYQPQLATSQTWEKRVLEQALELLDKAMASYDSIESEGERETLKTRVLKESFCVRYLILRNYSFYYNGNTSAYTDMVEQFRKDAAKIGAVSVSEGSDLNTWIDSLV